MIAIQPSQRLAGLIVSIRFVGSVIAILTLLLVGACGGPPPPERQLEVTATEMQFTPDRLEARVGEQVFVRLRNRGTVAHSLTIDLPTGQRTVSADAGVDAILTFTATEAGSYRFYCRVPGHEAQQGTLIVAP